jgi:hypothetical protein
MANALDRSLDEILADRKQVGLPQIAHRRARRQTRDRSWLTWVALQSGRGRGNRGSRGQRRDRQDYPRDGVRKVRATLEPDNPNQHT